MKPVIFRPAAAADVDDAQDLLCPSPADADRFDLLLGYVDTSLFVHLC